MPLGGDEDFCLVGSFDLATLELSDVVGGDLTFRIHSHPKLDIDPAGLYKIGESYKRHTPPQELK